MKRRQAIFGILGIGVAATSGVAGYKWFDCHKSPDLSFLKTHKETIAALSETIIPKTPDAPGAKEAGVANYIIVMIKDCIGKIEQNRFVEGVKAVNHDSIAQYDKPYYQLSQTQQIEVLKEFEKSGKSFTGIIGKVQNKLLGRSFFNILKELTVAGYCSSETGATKGLAYSHIPAQYIGCTILQPGQHSWATI